MRQSLLTLLLIVASTSDAKEQPVPSTITAVKVFLSGAEVTRTGGSALVKGTATLVFTGLSEEVDPSNIQVSGSGAFTILGVQHRLNYAEEKEDRAEVLELKARIKTLEADLARESSLLAVLEMEDARLAKNDVIAGDQGLALEQLRSINDYLQSRQEALALKRLERQATMASMQEELGKVRLQLARVQGRKTRPTSEVVVEVSANAPVSATLTLKYMVRSAGWSPSYDIRVVDITKAMQLTYKAQVYQNTGEDWEKVQLALSSGDPNKDAIMPQLYPWRLDFGNRTASRTTNRTAAYNAGIRDVRGIIRDGRTGEPLPFANVVLMDENGATINGTTTNFDGYYALAIPANGRSLRFSFVGFASVDQAVSSATMNIAMQQSLDMQEVVVAHSRGSRASSEMLSVESGVVSIESKRVRRSLIAFGEDEYDVGTGGVPANYSATSALSEVVVERATNFEFTINVPYTIPSDGQNHQVGVQDNELTSNYKYFCTPKLDLDAFLFAQVTGWEGMDLLDGPAYIYFEGTFIGESLLDLSGVGDTLDISLGRDQGISVQRTKRKDFSQRQVVGGKRVESVGWEIAVRNNKAQAVDLVITDQFPIAVRSEIEVKLDEHGGASVNMENGFLTWKAKVEPRTDQQFQFGYSVKVPKGRAVMLE